MEILIVLALLLLLTSALAPAVYALRKRMAEPVSKLEFWRVLARRGVSSAETAAQPQEVGVALRRCTLCPSVDACNRWLALGAREGLEEFCPNADYVKKLERA